MNIEIDIVKGIPAEQIDYFEDRVVYATAVQTRELTKSRNNFPYLSGKLMRSEVGAPIVGTNKEYGLTAGVDYATYVWNFQNPKWTNKMTKPQWYYTNFNEKGAMLLINAVINAKKEIR